MPNNKNKDLTLKDIKKMAKAVSKSEKIVGFIGGTPVIERKDCPPGCLYALNEKEFKRIIK